MFSAAITAAAFLLLAMTLLWLLSLAIRDAGIVDIFWGLGFVGSYWLGFAAASLSAAPFMAPSLNSDAGATAGAGRHLLVGLLLTIWGVRLALHIWRRNRGQGEDFRYARWRAEAGQAWWWRSYFKVFLLQGVVLWLVAWPLFAVLGSAGPALGWLDFLALLVWAVGFVFEAGGDWQLGRFKRDPANKGRLLTSGFWRYTRHPNYFGDAVVWWGFYLFAVAAGAWWTLFSPLLMTFLLRRVSGVTMLERTLRETKPGYAAYAARTNAFIPGRPKKGAAEENMHEIRT